MKPAFDGMLGVNLPLPTPAGEDGARAVQPRNNATSEAPGQAPAHLRHDGPPGVVARQILAFIGIVAEIEQFMRPVGATVDILPRVGSNHAHRTVLVIDAYFLTGNQV